MTLEPVFCLFPKPHFDHSLNIHFLAINSFVAVKSILAKNGHMVFKKDKIPSNFKWFRTFFSASRNNYSHKIFSR